MWWSPLGQVRVRRWWGQGFWDMTQYTWLTLSSEDGTTVAVASAEMAQVTDADMHRPERCCSDRACSALPAKAHLEAWAVAWHLGGCGGKRVWTICQTNPFQRVGDCSLYAPNEFHCRALVKNPSSLFFVCLWKLWADCNSYLAACITLPVSEDLNFEAARFKSLDLITYHKRFFASTNDKQKNSRTPWP